MVARKLGHIYLYVMKIIPENCIDTPWQQENQAASIVCDANQT